MALTHKFVQWSKKVLTALERESINRQATVPNVVNPEIRLEDGIIALVCAILLFSLRLVIIHLVSERWFPKYEGRLKRKISENLFYTMFHFTSALLFIQVMQGENWSLWPFTNDMIVRQLVEPRFPPVSAMMRFMYMFDLGFWISATFFICFVDKRLSDFGTMLSHHVSTLSLILISYRYGYMRFGIIMMVLHDLADIFLYGAKFVHYLGYEPVDTMIFAIFAVVFYVSRLLVLPRLIYAAAVETLQITVDIPGFNQWGAYIDTYLYHWLVFVALLSFLQIIQCFWFSLILKMIYRQLFQGKRVSEQGDIRDSSDSESE